MSSSVTTKALQSGCAVLSHTPGFFSTAAVSWPVTGAGLVCRALAMADRSVLSELEGPTPEQSEQNSSLFKIYSFDTNRVVNLKGYSPCKPLGRSIDFISSSAISNAFNPLSFRSQNSCRPKPNKNFPKTVQTGGFSSLFYLSGLVHSLLWVRLHLVVGMICYLGDRLLEDGRRLSNWQRCV